MEWINVKDSMPKGRKILLTYSKEVVIGDFYKGIWRIDGATFWENRKLKSNYKLDDIIKWMELPKL